MSLERQSSLLAGLDQSAQDKVRVSRSFKPARLSFAAAMLGLAFVAPQSAYAIPSFALQTNQPCSACHIGAFGPRLKQFGRDFKLYGYVANDLQPHPLPVSVILKGSFTHTNKDEIDQAINGYSKNDNFAFDEADVYYGGKLANNAGLFLEVAWDPVTRSVTWGDMDLRYAKDYTVYGDDVVVGATFNNAPTESDIWEAEPQWSYPYIKSQLADSPQAGPIVDAMPGTSVGAGFYADWNSTLYVEADIYNGLGRDALHFVGSPRLNGTDVLSGPMPYWRVALEHSFEDGKHYVELGTYGLSANVYPNLVEIGGVGPLHRRSVRLHVSVDSAARCQHVRRIVVSRALSHRIFEIRRQRSPVGFAPFGQSRRIPCRFDLFL